MSQNSPSDSQSKEQEPAPGSEGKFAEQPTPEQLEQLKQVVRTKERYFYNPRTGRTHIVLSGQDAARYANDPAYNEVSREKVRELRRERNPEKLLEDTWRRYQSGQIGGEEVEKAVDRAMELQGYTEKPIVTQAPKGFYYRSAEEVAEANRGVIEWNREVREYKMALLKGVTAPPPPQRQPGTTAQGREFDLVSDVVLGRDELPMNAGPPEPSLAEREEALRRRAAGLPSGPGIPGPGMAPRPGSIGEKLAPVVTGAVQRYDELFQAVTGPARGFATQLEEASVEAVKEPGLGPVLGFAEYGTAKMARIGAMALDVATFEARPQLWADVGRTVLSVAFEPEAREALVGQIARDPFGFVSEQAGGIALGTHLKAVTIPRAAERLRAVDWGKVEARIAQAIPTEDPFRSLPAYDRLIAAQPLKTRPFMEGLTEPTYIQIPRLAALYREVKMATRFRPTLRVKLESVPYWQPKELYVQTGPLDESRIVNLLEEARAATRLRLPREWLKSQSVPYWQPKELYVQTEPKLAGPIKGSGYLAYREAPRIGESKLLDLVAEARARSRLRPVFKVPTVTIKPSATLYRTPTMPTVAEIRLRQLIRTAQQEAKLRPRLGVPLEKITPSARLYEAPRVPSVAEIRARVLYRTLQQEAKAATHLRPKVDLGKVEYRFPKTRVEPAMPYRPPVSEQLKGLEAYEKGTYAHKAEKFMSRTFQEPFESVRYEPPRSELPPLTKMTLDTSKGVAIPVMKIVSGPPGLYPAPPQQKDKGPWGAKNGWAKLGSAYFPRMPPEVEKQIRDLEGGVKARRLPEEKLKLPEKPKIRTEEKSVVIPVAEIKALERPVQRPRQEFAAPEKPVQRERERPVLGSVQIPVVEVIQVQEQRQKQVQVQSLVFTQAQMQSSVVLSAAPLYEGGREEKRRKRRGVAEERMLPLPTEEEILEDLGFKQRRKRR